MISGRPHHRRLRSRRVHWDPRAGEIRRQRIALQRDAKGKPCTARAYAFLIRRFAEQSERERKAVEEAVKKWGKGPFIGRNLEGGKDTA